MLIPTPAPTGSSHPSADAAGPTAVVETGVSRLVLAACLLAAAISGALLGAAGTRHAAPEAPSTTAGAAAVPLPAGSGHGGFPGAAVSHLHASHADAPDRQALMQRYATELDEDARGALLAELQRHPDDVLRDFALGLVASGDADGRLRGYELLSAFPLDDADTRGAMLAGLRGEQDPVVLARVAELVVPTVLPAGNAGEIADALGSLATHDDPEVRARGVVQAAQWAAPGEAEGLLAGALLDESPQVREAAVAGVIATRAHSPRLKDALLWIAGDASTDPGQRASAVFALQWYRLDDAEYAIYRQAEADTGHAH